MQNFLLIFSHELRIYSRNFGRILANFLFFLISVTIFSLLSQSQNFQGDRAFYSITIIWFSLLSCLIFSATEFLKKDFEDGTIEQIITSCDNFEIFILAKMLTNWLICAAPILISIFPISVFVGLDYETSKILFVLAVLATLNINFICTFCGSLSVLGNAAPMIGIIALPLVAPILLLACGGVGSDFFSNVKILSGLVVFLGCVSIFAAAKIVKIAAE